MLSYHFVRTEVLSLEHGTQFSNLLTNGTVETYEDFAYCDAALVDYLRPRAEAFIKSVESLAQEINGSLPNKNKHILLALPSSSSCHYAISKRR